MSAAPEAVKLERIRMKEKQQRGTLKQIAADNTPKITAPAIMTACSPCEQNKNTRMI
jgi:hypothetical protein